ncbi:uncharacterized protein LOC126373371 isoform X1 [Pectinophora gossypiella]|uniref:uncharacterized protein LOC126373371 isoform X1 n=1 Tax=Pectinophora gossypiella TaxID=13191 RepID=UPI00214E34A3|nr:uncharacterized protein LOC126373371 isoform X1 [Pectinophora gossypiella]
MSSRNKIKCGINVETGALIFAMFNFVFTGLAVIASLGLFCYTLGEWNYNTRRTSVFMENDKDLMVRSASLMVVVFAIIALVFAIILVIGVVQRKPGCLKVYLVYGVLVVVLSTATAICLTFLFRNNYSNFVTFMNIISAIVITLFFYTLVLLTIRSTYKKYEREMNPPHYFTQNILPTTDPIKNLYYSTAELRPPPYYTSQPSPEKTS